MNANVSVIVPTLNESARVAATLAPLQSLRRSGHQVILVDGGSEDGTPRIASGLVDRVLSAPRGRAAQMNVGARSSRGDTLWFLHADTVPSPEAIATLVGEFPACGRAWGRFDVRLSGGRFVFRVVEASMNLRSRLSGIATGDQGIFVQRVIFDEVGGFPEIPLMEDVALSRRLRRKSRPFCPRRFVVTSSRRWEERGVLRTVLLMWRLRLAYAMGADPARLAKAYTGSSAAEPSQIE